jgi:hypothetical protein
VTPEAEAVLHFEIGQVLRGFAVREVYGNTLRPGYRRYAVWDARRDSSHRVSEPGPHGQARADLIRLQTEAILQLIKELEPDACAAD